MGAWGNGLFESDDAYDAVGDLSSKVGCELLFADDAKVVRSKLTAKKIDKLLAESIAKKRFIEVAYLGAIAMQYGAALTKKQRKTVLKYADAVAVTRGDTGADALKHALANYTDGVMWDFESKGLLETMAEHIASGGKGLINK